MYLKEDDITDINRIDEYNDDYKRMYPDFKPFVTRENLADFLKSVEDKKNGIGNNGVKEIFYFAIEDDKILNNTKVKSYLKKNNINSLYEAERFLYKNRNAKNSIFTSVSDIIAKQELVNLVKLYTTRTPYIIEVNDNSYIYKLGDDIYNYMVFTGGKIYTFSFNNKNIDNLSYVKDIIKTIKIYE